MLKQQKGSTNPLRISQESLDLDDIISDLNSEMMVVGGSNDAKNPSLEVEGVKVKANTASVGQSGKASGMPKNASSSVIGK